MDLRGYLRAVRKYWWIVVLVTLFGAGAGVALSLRAEPKYASSVTFYVSVPGDATGTALQNSQYAQKQVNTFAEFLDTDRFARLLIRDAGIDMSVPQIQAAISASADVDTVLVSATITESSPARSLALATAVSEHFGPFVVDDLGSKGVVLEVVEGPGVNLTPVSPRTTLNIGLGFLVGFALGIGLAVLREVADTTIRSLDSLRAVTNLPALGSVGYDSSARKSPLLVGAEVRSIRAEAFRQLRTNLQFADAANPVRVIVVTSSIASEGKSSTATNLAIVAAESGRRVLLIEADLRRPRVSDYLGLERAVGLSNVLAGQVDYEDVVQPWGADNLMVLPSGSVPPNPSELLGSQNMAVLVKELRAAFDMIIIDTPPLLPVTDAAVVSAQADGVMMVVRYAKATRTQVTTAIGSLKSVDARILGCVLVMRPTKGADSQGGYDGYGYYEDKTTTVVPIVTREEIKPRFTGKHHGRRATTTVAGPVVSAGAERLSRELSGGADSARDRQFVERAGHDHQDSTLVTHGSRSPSVHEVDNDSRTPIRRRASRPSLGVSRMKRR